MSRSHYPAKKEPRRASDILPSALERARRNQYAVHRAPAGSSKIKKRGGVKVQLPPLGGWKGGQS